MQLVDQEIIQERYDRYVKYYNTSKNPIATYAELLTVKEGLQKRLGELKEKVDLYIDDIEYFLGEIFDSTPSSDVEDSAEDLLASNHRMLVENITGHIRWEVGNLNHIHSPDEFINFNSNQIAEIYRAYNKYGQEGKALRALKSIIVYGQRYEQAFYHLLGVKSITNRIIDENYPKNLVDYRGLEVQEKEEILGAKRKGAPLRADVPQDEVEQIVTKLLHQYMLGQSIITNRNGQKRMFKIIHESGKYEGNVNINQIFKYIETAHPELINISDRQFKKRIKKAVPEGMK
ncbi:hypothetical protein [Halalkalibaculum sp. DA384]|uniref:hypothetical protein n=1 Tax=Halalkalibaculum sp. DA384 TaxID=3373606 RepID=UPI003754CA67